MEFAESGGSLIALRRGGAPIDVEADGIAARFLSAAQ
jgi:hypothetical protein